MEWYAELSRAHELWSQGMAIEDKEWNTKLEAYLQKAQLESLRDVCQSRDHPGIEEPKPATSHDLNYGDSPLPHSISSLPSDSSRSLHSPLSALFLSSTFFSPLQVRRFVVSINFFVSIKIL